MNTKAIKKLIKGSGLKKKAIAQRACIDPRTLSKILAGCSTTIETMESLAKVLGVPIETFFLPPSRGDPASSATPDWQSSILNRIDGILDSIKNLSQELNLLKDAILNLPQPN
ncbi:MAG: helix-turn-helix domain-containing protein [Bacteroidales bacterium]|nr:helix-turn-helix domain-containing protein [Bacteroidales bacterium]